MSTSNGKTTNGPSVSVTNNSGVDVEIFDVYNPHPKSDPGLYQYTPLGKVSNTQTETIQTIHFASQLLAVYNGNMKLNGITVVYEKFPVAVIGICAMDPPVNKKPLPPYNWAISADDYTGMQQAFSLIVYTTANPDSVTAQNFQTALNTVAENKDTLHGTAVNTFFQNSASFSKATWVAWNQVVSWQTQSLSAWQGTYYLYNEPSGDETLQLMAVVNIVSNINATSGTPSVPDENGIVQPDAQSTGIMTSGTLSVPDQNGIVQPDAQSTGIVQSGTGTITQADPAGSAGSDTGMVLSLSVVPAWASIATTNADSVNYAIGGSMLGTFNNTKVGGNGQKMNIPTITPTITPTTTPTASSGGQPSATSLIFSVLAAISSFAMVLMMYMQWRESKNSARDKVVNKNLDPKKNIKEIKAEQDSSAAIPGLDMTVSRRRGMSKRKALA